MILGWNETHQKPFVLHVSNILTSHASMPVTLYYYTGWQECQLHGCPKGDSAWRDMAFKTVPGKPSVHELHVEADGLEFVVCDMQKKYWDNPPDWYGKKNYLISEAGKYSLRNGHLRRIRDTPVLVVTDLDHTLIGHERDPENKLLEDFKTTWLGEYAPNGSALAYSTGRNKSMALDVAKERHLPRPELLICGVGTEVYAIPSSLPLFDWWEAGASLQLMPEWKSKVLDGFDRKYVEDILLAAFPKFELRGTPEDDPYRIPTAYQMDENFDAGKRTLQETLGEKYQVISSGHGEWKLIDICSSQAGKGKALEFAQRELKFEPGRTLACGDSGNDELMFRCDGSYGVMVANSLPELVEAMTKNAQDSVLAKGKTFKTQHGSTMLYASQEVSAGIVEALLHFWP